MGRLSRWGILFRCKAWVNACVSLLFVVALHACAAERAYIVQIEGMRVTLDERQQGVMALFQALPDWTSEEYSKEDMHILSEICEKLSVYSNDEIESALVVLSDHQNFPYPSISDSSRAFIIMRAIFELPESISTQGLRYYSSFNSLQNTEALFHLQWPLKFDDEGYLLEVQSFTGCHGSCAYHFLREFRSFRRLYNRRKFLAVSD